MIPLRVPKFTMLFSILGVLMLLSNQATGREAPQATALRVLAIEIDGKAADSVSGVPMTDTAEGTAKKSNLKKGEGIAQGTEIVIPPRTVLVLETANGNQIRLQAGSGFKTHLVIGRGETHTLLFGEAYFKVKNALDFFNVNYESFLASVRGTEFSVSVEPKKEISFTLDKGKLLVQRDVKVKILEENKVATLTASEVLEQGKKTQVRYRLGIDEYLKEFKTFRNAEEYYRRKLEEDEQSGEYDRVKQGLNDLGNILVTLGKDKEAIGYYDKSLSQNLKLYPEGVHPNISMSYIGIGNAYVGLGEYSKAIEYYEKSLSQNLKLYPEGIHPNIAMSYLSLGVAFDGHGEHGKAIEYYEKSLSQNLKLYPEGVHPYIAKSYIGIGNAYVGLGEYSKAIEYYEKSLSQNLKLYPEGAHPDIAGSYISLGIAYDGHGEHGKAIEYYEKSLSQNLKLYPEGVHPDIARNYMGLGNFYYGLGEYRKAIEYYDKSLSQFLKLYSEGLHPDIAQSYRNLSFAYKGAGEQARANEYAQKAQDVETRLKGK